MAAPPSPVAALSLAAPPHPPPDPDPAPAHDEIRLVGSYESPLGRIGPYSPAAAASESPTRAKAPSPRSPSGPTISISSSPSTVFASSSSPFGPPSSPNLPREPDAPSTHSTASVRRGSTTSVSTGSSSTSTPSLSGASSTRRSFAHLSLKPKARSRAAARSSRPRSAGSEGSTGLDATSADAAPLGPDGGRLARGLRKTRSGLRLVQKAKEQAAADPESPTTYSSTADNGATPTGPVFLMASGPGDLPISSAAAAAATSDGTQAPLGPNSNVANRIGGWFTSMLHPAGTGPSGASPGSALSLSSSSSASDPGPPASSEKSRTTATARATVSPPSASPRKKGASASSSSGPRFGPLDRMLDRAVQYFLDSDSQADRCEDDIWVLGVRHPGWQAPPSGGGEDPDREEGEDESGETPQRSLPGRVQRERGSPTKQRRGGPAPPPPPPPSPGSTSSTIHGWPASFYRDFYSRPALTYRSHFPVIPFEPSPAASAPNGGAGGGGGGGGVGAMLSTLGVSIGRGSRAGEERGLSTDTGWGCMLRTGQSLLANALVKVYLGRDWRRPLPVSTGDPSATIGASIPSAGLYARLLSLFLDDPSPLSPFSVHRFALEGQRLGKDVGEWFGPSTAAGAIRSLVHAYEPAGLRVVSCMDGAVYESEVLAASTSADGAVQWSKPVLVLINLRLGIDGINPLYHEAVKGIFRFPQSVGIAGGRPSSSYYFVGAQGDALIYIDPHHPRPAVPLVRPDSPTLVHAAQHVPLGPRHTGGAGAVDPQAQQLEHFLLESYPDRAWATYHCDRVRKCALASLDPSMLLGFVMEDQRDWTDFCSRVEQLSQGAAPIFSIAPSPPRWMRRTTSSAQSQSGPSRPAAAAPTHRRRASTRSGSTPTVYSTAVAGVAGPEDDSFSELGVDVDDEDDGLLPSSAPPRAGSADPPPPPGEGGRGDPATGSGGSEAGSSPDFSEPEEWELQSTDGSALEDDNDDDDDEEVVVDVGSEEDAGGRRGEERDSRE